MHVVTRKRLREFAAQYHDAGAPLAAWFKLMRGCKARSLPELKRTFGSVDYVSAGGRDFHIFDIGGNKYRLIVVVNYRSQTVFIRHVLTHQQYDAGKWRNA